MIQIPDENVVVRVGPWQFMFRIILAGCDDDLKRLSPAQRQAIVDVATEVVREREMRIITEFPSEEMRSRLRAEVATRLGSEAVSDLYLNLLSAEEHM